jgi:hypothetical protein
MENKEFAPGLPDKNLFDKINQNGETRLVIQKHLATTPHYDLRLQDKNIAHSWVIKSLPGEQTRILAIRQPTHTTKYMDFEGKIESGYGKGTVKKVYDKDVHVLYANDKKIKMVLPEGEFTMLKPEKFKDTDWLMIRNKPIKNPITDKPQYKVITKPLDFSDKNKVLQPKVDGANAIFDLRSEAMNRIYSYRTSKKTGMPIDHSHQVPGLRDLEIPKSLDGTVLRGELYATKNGKPLPAETIGGILNSKLDESLKKQKELGKLKPYIFDIVKYKGKDVSEEPYAAKYDLLKSVQKKLPQLRVAETAFTSSAKQKLVDAIKSGNHPKTVEGVIEWDLTKSTGDPKKLKFRDTHDVYIREIFPAISGVSGKEKDEAGGFKYSWTKNGPIVGNVGTGFDKLKRQDMWKNKNNYVGKVARVKSQQKYKSGSLRAPSFYSLDIEKNLNLEKISQFAFLDEIKNLLILNE